MTEQDIQWQRELDRRARIYEDIELGDRWEGRMSRLDYAMVSFLIAALVCGFWIWGG